MFEAITAIFGVKKRTSDEPKEIQDESIQPNKSKLKGARVLLAEDNATNQEIALAVLESAGIVATIANNSKEAVQMVCEPATCPFDLILMDMQMPEMDGYEATRKIREDKRFGNLPIIAMTAHAMKGDEEKCLAAGMNGYITKPINQNTFFATISKFYQSQNTHGQGDRIS